MYKKHFINLLIVASLFLIQATVSAQEFPIAVGSDTTFSAAAAYDGQNWLVGILGDSSSQYNVTAQLVDPSGNLIGTRISLGATGFFPGPIPIFDGINYFLVWCNFYGNLEGQFLDISGNLIGTSVTIATNLSINRENPFSIAISDSTYLVVFIKTDSLLYGQIVNKTGNLIGNQISISNFDARDFSVAYDGVNYLVAWVDDRNDKDIYGQFVKKDGALVGSNFVIDNGPNFSDNPTSLAFDGTRYLMAFHEAPDYDAAWTLAGCFITTSGTIQETFTICDSTNHPLVPSVAYDGTDYFITWSQLIDNTLMGRFFDASGVPVDPPFTVFGTLGNKIPVGRAEFGGGQYLVVATRVDSIFSDGDVYGRFLQPVTGIEGENTPMPAKIELLRNYPNPFNPTTTISFKLPLNSFVSLNIYDAMGRQVATLVSEKLTAGTYARQWNAEGLASGVYFYRLQAGSFIAIRKLVLLR